MANVGEVLSFLCPNVEWSLIGDQYEDINWYNKTAPITKKEFEDGFDKVDAWKSQQEINKNQAKTDLLNRLGITSEELAVLLA
jgi:hypothetical protein